MKAGALVVLILFITALPASSQVPGESAVMPGARIGKWTLEMSVQEVVRVNGPVSARPSAIAAFIPDVAWYSWDALPFAAGTHDRKRIDFLAIYQSREYQTQRGIGYRALRKEVVSAYGAPTFEGDIFVQGQIDTLLVYNKIGLAFILNDGVVQALLVFRPGEMEELLMSC